MAIRDIILIHLSSRPEGIPSGADRLKKLAATLAGEMGFTLTPSDLDFIMAKLTKIKKAKKGRISTITPPEV